MQVAGGIVYAVAQLQILDRENDLGPVSQSDLIVMVLWMSVLCCLIVQKVRNILVLFGWKSSLHAISG